MILRKIKPRTCLICFYSNIEDELIIKCKICGERASDLPCKYFRYDPCKRIPPRPKAIDFSEYNDTDYSL